MVRLAYVTRRGAHVVRTIQSDAELDHWVKSLCKQGIEAEAWVEPKRDDIVARVWHGTGSNGREQWLWTYERMEVAS